MKIWGTWGDQERFTNYYLRRTSKLPWNGINYFSSRSIFDKRCLLTPSQRSKSETWCYMTFESIPLWNICSCKTVLTQHQGSSTTFELHIITSRACSIKFSSKQYTMWLISLSPWWISLCYHFLYANLKNVLYPHDV